MCYDEVTLEDFIFCVLHSEASLCPLQKNVIVSTLPTTDLQFLSAFMSLMTNCQTFLRLSLLFISGLTLFIRLVLGLLIVVTITLTTDLEL